MKLPFNNQAIVKPARTNGDMLLVHSIFWTLQGEGPFSGHPAVFLRLAGCNLQCPFCDTEYTDGARQVTVRHAMNDVEGARPPEAQGRKLLVITGGEPFRQNLGHLINEATDDGWHVQIETNGVLQPQDYSTVVAAFNRKELTVVVSPKTARVSEAVEAVAACFKYVLAADSVNPDDGLPYFALGNKCSPHVARPPVAFDLPVYVNPMDAKDPAENKANLQAAAASCMKYGYICGTQLHKAIGLE